MTKKKLLALLLALVMTFSLVPVTAFADGPEFVAMIGETGYATLTEALANVTKDAPLTSVTEEAWPTATPVYYNGTFFTTEGSSQNGGGALDHAIAQANTDHADSTDIAKIYVRPGYVQNSPDNNTNGLYLATYNKHQPITSNIEIYGNGASLNNERWEPCVEYNGNGYPVMTRDVSVSIYSLHDGAGIWGQHYTPYTMTVNIENCNNVHEYMVNAGSGDASAIANITIRNCTFDCNGCAHTGVIVASTNPGTVTIDNCTFANSSTDFAININNKIGGTNTVTISDCAFTNCGNTTDKSALRICGAAAATMSATLSNLTFTNCTNTCDIEIGTVSGGSKNSATVSYNVSGTNADMFVYTVNTNTLKNDGATTLLSTNNYSGNNAVEAAPDWTGAGTEQSPWIIANEADLRLLAERVNGAESATYKSAYYQLGADIALTESFTPIGSGYYSSSHNPNLTEPAFSGTFDGNNHTISNLTVNTTGEHAAGLFGIVNGGTIKNLTVSGATVTSAKRYAGAIVGGLTAGTIDNCHVTGTIAITGEHFVGGLAGLSYGTIKNSSVNATGTITGVDRDATIDDGDDVGGLVGFVQGSNGKVQNSDVTAASGELTISGIRQVGGIAGAIDTSASIDSDSVATGVTVKSTASDDKTNANKDTNTIGIVVGRITANATNAGTATGSTLEIATKGQLESFCDAVNAGNSFYGNTVKLTENIDLTGVIWTPIGYSARKSYANHSAEELSANPYFGGTFNGNGHTITGLSNYNSNSQYEPVDASIRDNEYVYGLFGAVGNGATIQNVTLTNVNIDTTKTTSAVGDSVGALAGYAFGNFAVSNVSVSGTVKANDAVGGIVGRAYKGNYTDTTQYVLSLTGNTSSATVIGGTASGAKAGGLFGYVSDNSKGYYTITMTGNSFTGSTAVSGYFNSPIAVFDKTMFNSNFSTSTAAGHTNTSIAVNSNTANGNTTEWDRDNANNVVFLKQVEPDNVAEIGTTKYATLAEAVGAITTSGTITLLDDFTLSEYVTIPAEKTVTLDYNGYTITSTLTGAYAPIENYGTLTVVDTSDGHAGGIEGVNRCINNYGTLNVGAGDFDASTKTTSNKVFGGNYSTINRQGGTAIRGVSENVMNFYDCVVNATNYAVVSNGTATVYGGTFNGDSCSVCSDSSYFYTFSSKGSLTIYDATITGVHGALAVVAGSADVYGGTFNTHECTRKIGSHSSVTSGVHYALYVAGEQDVVGCNVYGGTFSSEGVSVVDIGNNAIGDGGNREPATCHIKGGTFTKLKAAGSAIISVDTTLGNLELTGGTFTGFDAAQATAFNTKMTNGNYVADGYALNQTSDVTYEVVATYVAETAGTQYATVEAAIAAAANNGTVTLLTNASLTGTTDLTLEKSITLDLAGHTLTAERINLKKGGLNVVTSVEGGTVTSSGQTFNVYGSETNAANYTTLTIGEGVTVNGNYAICLFPVNNMTSYGATINVNGTLTGTKGTVFVSGNLGNSAETGAALASSANISVINVGATAEITSSGDQAIAMNGMAKVNVADGAKLTGREAIGLKRGILNVSGGTFTANGALVAKPTANNNGTEATGAALSITSTYNYAGNIQANISGGYFTSVNGAAFLASQAVKNAQAIAFADGNPILMITGGVFDDDTVKTYVASGYEAAALNSGNSYGGETAAYDGWYKVGVLTVSSVAAVAENQITAHYDATYTATKTVTAEDNSQQLAAASTVTVNVVTTKTETSSAVVANTEAHTTAKYDVASVVESAIDMANTTDTTLNVSINIVSDNPAVDTSTAIPTITYEIHPVATVTSKTGDADPTEVGSFKVTNDQLKDGASFDLQLTVPDAVYNAAAEADSKRYVIAKHVSEENASTETYKREIKGTAGGYYIELTVTHFSQFELEPMTLTNAVYGEAKVSATLSLSDSIDIIFYVKDIVGDVSHYTVEYSFGDAASVEKAVTDGTSAGDGKYGFTVASCAAKQMTDTVSFKVKYDGVVIFSINDYSIQSYCENKIAASGTTAKLRELCYAVLDYGASAQNFFDYETSNIANATYSNMSEVEALTLPNDWAVTTTGDKANAGISKISATLNTVSQTEIYFYITPTGSQKANDYTVTAVDKTNGANALISWSKSDQSDGRILVVVSGIAAKYLGDQYTLTVNGKYTVTYSPMSYAYNKQNGANGLGNLVKAMYQYSVKAAAFFE